MFFKALFLTAALEFGFLHGGIYNYSDLNRDWIDVGALYVSTEAVVHYKAAYLGGGINCAMTPISIANYAPFQLTFSVVAGLDFNGVKIGWEHDCFHPMQPYVTAMGSELKPKYEGAYDRIFVRIETDKGSNK